MYRDGDEFAEHIVSRIVGEMKRFVKRTPSDRVVEYRTTLRYALLAFFIFAAGFGFVR